MDEKEVSSGGHGSDGNELEDNKKKAKKAPKGGAQSLNASPRRGFSPRFGPPPENHHLHQAKKKKKGKKGRDGDDGDETIHLEEEGGSRVRDRSKTLDYSTMSEVSSRLQEKEKKEKKNKGATATREGRSATTFEAPAPSKLNSSKSKRSSSVRNALTCFIPSSAKESPATDETMIDKKKMGDMITLAAEAEDDDGGSGKRKKKKAGKSGSTSTTSSSSSSSSSLPSSPSRAPTVHHHRLSGGMAFGDDQRGATKKHRRNLSALEDLQYNNVVVVAANKGTAAPLAIPTSSSSPTLDSRPSKVRIPASSRVSFCECARLLRAVSACAVCAVW